MLNRLNSVSVAAVCPTFVTLTLPDESFRDSVSAFAKDAKAWLDTFLKRLRRVCPEASGFWRIEWLARKSGHHEGKLFPHFHLLVWGLPERQWTEARRRGEGEIFVDVFEPFVRVKDCQLTLDLLRVAGSTPAKPGEAPVELHTHHGSESFVFAGERKFVQRCQRLLFKVGVAEDRPDSDEARMMSFTDWAALAWYHVVDSHNPDHVKAGVRVERVRTWGGVMSYCAKYMAKSDCGFLYEIPMGRSWGIFNRACVPWAKMIQLDLEPSVGVRLRRVARHYLERRFGRRVRMPYGVTLYCDVQQFRRLWRPSPDPDPF